MSFTRTLVVASALVLMPLALAGCGVAETPVIDLPSAAPVEPEKTDAPAEPTAGFTTLVDDTGVITVDVPVSWTQVDGAPQGPATVLAASPDLQGFYSRYDVPGVSIFATQEETVGIDGYIEKYLTDFGGDCEDGETDVYDDGYYVGKYLYLPNCGGVGDLAVVAAVDPESTYIVLVAMNLVSDADKNENAGQVLSTFFVQY